MSKQAKKRSSRVKMSKSAVQPARGAMIVGNPQRITDVTPDGWEPDYIEYYKLGLSNQYGWYFDYELAGLAVDSNNDLVTDIQAFIADVRGGSPTVRPFQVKPLAPHIRLTALNCYVVIELVSDVNWRFLQNYPALMIEAGHTDPYFGLKHIDTNGVPYASAAPAGGPTCQLMYFGVTPVSGAKYPTVDQFSLYLECSQNFDPSLAIVLDPDIKNDGGTVPPLLDQTM